MKSPKAVVKPPKQVPPVMVRDGVGASRVYCPPGAWGNLIDFLCDKFPAIDRLSWQARMDTSWVLDAQGQSLKANTPYQQGATVYYFRAVPTEQKLPYEATIVYRDEYLVVADKPHFLPVVPSGKYVQETLLVRLKKQLNLPELSPIHRIDRDTAGLVLFSVRAQDRGAYQELFRDGKVSKTYQAIAPRAQLLSIVPLPYVLNLCLEDAPNFMQMQVVQGKPSNSSTVISNAVALEGQVDLMLYTLQPQTGKRHQLRVHMLSIGAPIVGDHIYPVLMPERDISQAQQTPLMLLAQQLRFIDPLTRQLREFTSARKLEMNV